MLESPGCCRFEIVWAYRSTASRNVRHRCVPVAAKDLSAQTQAPCSCKATVLTVRIPTTTMSSTIHRRVSKYCRVLNHRQLAKQ